MQGLIGKNVGQFQIVEQIGQGGMATIFKAYQPAIDRYVAVKILPREFANDPNFLKRFAQEAKAIAALEHPHILPVHDFGSDGDINFMVMRYVKGGTLSDKMGAPQPLGTVVKYVGAVARALDYAHQRGVVHRDIKPSNILIDEHGQVLLTDFGIAKMMEGAESTQLTAAGSILGTPAYMSPEQAQSADIDGRSDIYSLGVILYELLTGQPPYQAETPFAIVFKHMSAPLPPPRSINPNIPEAFERIVLKSMAKQPDDRFQTAGEMAAALEAALHGTPASATGVTAAIPAAPSIESQTEPVLSRPTPPPKTAAKKSITPLLVIGTAVAVVLCLAAGGLALLLLSGSTDAPPQTDLRGSEPGNDQPPPEAVPGEVFEFEETFDQNLNGWPVESTQDEYGATDAVMEDGVYHLAVFSDMADGNTLWVEPEIPEVANFVYSVEARPLGPPGDFLYGLVFRSTPEGDATIFEIAADGVVVVQNYPDGNWEEVTDFIETDALSPLGEVNELTVVAEGSNLLFFVNGEEVANLEGRFAQPGSIGLIAEVFGEGGEFAVEFDNLHVTPP